MREALKQVLETPYTDDQVKKTAIDKGDDLDFARVHAFIFMFDCSNKRTYESLICIMNTIYMLEKGKSKGAGGKAGKKGQQPFFPKKIVVGNKKDLKVNRDAGGTINKEDINKLLEMFPNIKVKEVSALTNLNISEVFQTLVKELNEDAALKEVSAKHCE